jgi:HAE1 family hydrophobic/amphiphilic exporter-1
VSLKDAAVEGAKLRFRPIQMTSFAFIAGLLPLVMASGAGAIGNRTIGTTGAGGMLVGTVVGVLVIPGLYYLFGQLDGGRKLLRDESGEPLSEIFEHNAQEAHDGESTHDRDHNGLPLPRETAELPASLVSEPVFRLPFPLEIPASAEEVSTRETPENTEEESMIGS